jgi:hypothetical protein
MRLIIFKDERRERFIRSSPTASGWRPSRPSADNAGRSNSSSNGQAEPEDQNLSQHFRNAVMAQIWTAMIDYLLSFFSTERKKR